MKQNGGSAARAGWLPSARSDDGVSAVIVAIVIVVMLGFSALVIDLGSLYRERRSLQTAADAAALAAVQELPDSTSAATAKAKSYASLNAPEATNVTVTFSSHFAHDDTVRVVLNQPKADVFFARIWGTTSAQVGAKAAARITSPVAYEEGVVPIGVIPEGGHECVPSAYGYGWDQQVTIKEGGGSGSTGNYGWVDLGSGGGASKVGDYIANNLGSGSLNETVKTVTGNKTSAADAINAWIGSDTHTFEQVCSAPDANGIVHINHVPGDPPEGCHRLIIVPIIVNPNGNGSTRYDWPNGKKDMQVIGFAQFFITSAGGTGSNAIVSGKFVQTVTEEEAAGGAVGLTGQVHYSLVE